MKTLLVTVDTVFRLSRRKKNPCNKKDRLRPPALTSSQKTVSSLNYTSFLLQPFTASTLLHSLFFLFLTLKLDYLLFNVSTNFISTSNWKFSSDLKLSLRYLKLSFNVNPVYLENCISGKLPWPKPASQIGLVITNAYHTTLAWFTGMWVYFNENSCNRTRL